MCVAFSDSDFWHAWYLQLAQLRALPAIVNVLRAAASDGSIVFWSRESGQHISTIKTAHKSAVVACSWGSNDELATVEREHSLVLWE